MNKKLKANPAMWRVGILDGCWVCWIRKQVLYRPLGAKVLPVSGPTSAGCTQRLSRTDFGRGSGNGGGAGVSLLQQRVGAAKFCLHGDHAG